MRASVVGGRTGRAGIALALVALAVAVGAPAAGATLVYEKGTTLTRPSVWVANDDGSAPRRLAVGREPRVAPDGQAVVYETAPTSLRGKPRLMVVPAAGGTPRQLLSPRWGQDTFAWSPDSKMVAAVTGKEISTKRLVLIDIATGTRRTISSGYFFGVSFSPLGDAIVYSRAARDRYPQRADLYTAPVSGLAPATRLTDDRKNVNPLWGPDSIVFARLRKPTRRDDAYKQDLYLIAPSGAGLRRLTRQRAGYLLSGLAPTVWSADGTRLLAEFGGQDTSYAMTVDPLTGSVRQVGSGRREIIGFDLARDGSTILGTTGGPDPGSRHNVVTVPYAGSRPRVLVRRAFNPDWNR